MPFLWNRSALFSSGCMRGDCKSSLKLGSLQMPCLIVMDVNKDRTDELDLRFFGNSL